MKVTKGETLFGLRENNDPKLFDAARHQTDIRRGLHACKVAKELIGKHRCLNITTIGIGMNAPFGIACSFEPYQIAAYLEKNRQNYNFTIVENDPNVINRFERQTKLFTPVHVEGYDQESFYRGLEFYCANTHQQPVTVNSEFPEISVWHDQDFKGYSRNNGGLYYAIHIPAGFERKTQTGYTTIKQQDVASVYAHIDTGQDFIGCSYVLYMLSQPEQKQAMYNLTRAMKDGGLMLITEDDTNPVLEQSGGWLGDDDLEAFGVRIQRIDPKHGDQTHIIFQKGKNRETKQKRFFFF